MECQKCNLCKTRTYIVLDRGSKFPYVLVIGEAPGRHEDEIGYSFVGPSGVFLSNVFAEALGVERFDPEFHGVCFTNVVRCRPTVSSAFPKQRPPTVEEINACLPYLITTIRSYKPSVIVRLGLNCQLHTDFLVRDAEWKHLKIVDLAHPAALLRRGGRKASDYQDYVKKLKEIWK